MRFSKKIVVIMLGSIFLFVITMIITFWKTGAVPDTLISGFFDFFKIEGGALAIIKIGEVVAETFEKKKTKKGTTENESELETETHEP